LTVAKTILIVEDNELNLKLFNDLLQAHGYNTVLTRNGRDAVRLAGEHRPDLILMDIQLPEISGLDVTRMIKADDALKDIPVVAVTAFAMKGDEEKFLEGGCEGYLAKPVSIDSLIGTVSRYLDAGGATPPARTAT
jgi:two-component system cell cycle response regulator DivK